MTSCRPSEYHWNTFVASDFRCSVQGVLVRNKCVDLPFVVQPIRASLSVGNSAEWGAPTNSRCLSTATAAGVYLDTVTGSAHPFFDSEHRGPSTKHQRSTIRRYLRILLCWTAASPGLPSLPIYWLRQEAESLSLHRLASSMCISRHSALIILVPNRTDATVVTNSTERHVTNPKPSFSTVEEHRLWSSCLSAFLN